MTKGSVSDDRILLIEKYRLARLLRITAYVIRFVQRCKEKVALNHPTVLITTRAATKRAAAANNTDAPLSKRAKGADINAPVKPNQPIPAPINIKDAIDKTDPPSTGELQDAIKYWITFSQKAHFEPELKGLQNGQPVPKNSSVRALAPFIEERTGIIRIRGRLKHATLTYDQQHPVLLPKESLLAQKLIEEAHSKTWHGGTQVCMQYIRDKYWIPSLRTSVKAYIRKCVRCVRYKKTMSQLMTDLPQARVRVGRPFVNCGVDYAGPF